MSCTISVLRLWHSYRFSNPFTERMTHLFAANSCGERRHTTLPADPTSPALPVASASKPSQELEARGNSGPGAPSPDPPGAGAGPGGERGTRRPREAAASAGGREGGDEVRESTPRTAMNQLLRFLKGSQGRCFSKQIGLLLNCLQSEKYKA